MANYLSRELLVAEVSPVFKFLRLLEEFTFKFLLRKNGALLRLYWSITGHLKEAKLFRLLIERFFWKDIFKDAKQALMSCNICWRCVRDSNHCPLKLIETRYLFEVVLPDTNQLIFYLGRSCILL